MGWQHVAWLSETQPVAWLSESLSAVPVPVCTITRFKVAVVKASLLQQRLAGLCLRS